MLGYEELCKRIVGRGAPFQLATAFSFEAQHLQEILRHYDVLEMAL
jgi:hypothetical protein